MILHTLPLSCRRQKAARTVTRPHTTGAQSCESGLTGCAPVLLVDVIVFTILASLKVLTIAQVLHNGTQ